ncbi:MAG: Unknown protein [uncultured Sulfurovum sp.]|uniref:Uncharacterized protein n=1 Tax=uncultured Sulfurovum sp. TaxID=269237 RepID=A0A6S6SBS1_9BACT|nr:MAG: Unknown protein [uncultured Sulfurovum sp.]
MANENKSLWPDFEANSIVTPKAILLEQGKFLSEKTKNILEVEVVTSAQANEGVILSFYIVAPNMNNYKYLLLYIKHDITLYPLDVHMYSTELAYKCKDQEALLVVLKDTFNHESTIKIIQSLLAQSK